MGSKIEKYVKWFLNLLEITRWVCVFVGFQWALNMTGTPINKFSVLCLWVVVPLTGFTGMESVFFGRVASKQTGYGEGGAYQRQSGLNNIAIAVTTILIYVLEWGIYAKIAVMTVTLVFLTLSAINHIISGVFEGNTKLKNVLVRPVGIILLLSLTLPFLYKVLIFIHK